MAGQQEHHFTSACQQPCWSELCACRQKGPERALVGQYGSPCAVRNELEPVAVVLERAHGFTQSCEKVGTFISSEFSLFFFFFMFDLFECAVPITMQWHSKHKAVKFVQLNRCMTSWARWILHVSTHLQWWRSAHYGCFYDWQSSTISVCRNNADSIHDNDLNLCAANFF